MEISHNQILNIPNDFHKAQVYMLMEIWNISIFQTWSFQPKSGKKPPL